MWHVTAVTYVAAEKGPENNARREGSTSSTMRNVVKDHMCGGAHVGKCVYSIQDIHVNCLNASKLY